MSGRTFGERYDDRIIDYGFGKITKSTKLVAAPVLVAKPPLANFRLTLDYSPVNAVTEPMTSPLSHIDSKLGDIAGSKYFAIIDFVSGYWQLPLAEECQELLSFMATNREVQPIRSTQGAKNSGPNFQAKMEQLFSKQQEQIKAWLDEFMIHEKIEDGLLHIIEKFSGIFRSYCLKVFIRKSMFFIQSVR